MRQGIFGFIAGAVTGAAVAILLTSEKGEKIKKQIGSFIYEASEIIKKNADVIIEEGKKHLEKAMSNNMNKVEKS